uniref:Uncharacterized protein n=1 Tax=Anopheles albimanus TaxID=7167 RepID=A0A182FYY3_ANOAL
MRKTLNQTDRDCDCDGPPRLFYSLKARQKTQKTPQQQQHC